MTARFTVALVVAVEGPDDLTPGEAINLVTPPDDLALDDDSGRVALRVLSASAQRAEPAVSLSRLLAGPCDDPDCPTCGPKAKVAAKAH